MTTVKDKNTHTHTLTYSHMHTHTVTCTSIQSHAHPHSHRHTHTSSFITSMKNKIQSSVEIFLGSKILDRAKFSKSVFSFSPQSLEMHAHKNTPKTQINSCHSLPHTQKWVDAVFFCSILIFFCKSFIITIITNAFLIH